jgi:hypothetical protein
MHYPFFMFFTDSVYSYPALPAEVSPGKILTPYRSNCTPFRRIKE